MTIVMQIRKSARTSNPAAVLVLGSILLASTAHAQWTVTSLHPAGVTESHANASGGVQQAGYTAIDGGQVNASLWNGTAESWVNLNPSGSTYSIVWATTGAMQAGQVFIDNFSHASLWTGTSASWVDLHPQGCIGSYVLGATNGEQVGYVYSDGDRASLWRGTASSWVDLHPAGATQSIAQAVADGQQAGRAYMDGVLRASVWTGTAASWVDLNPAGSTESQAFAISGGRQAGYALVGGLRRACLWTGSATSWVDLHPAGATSSYVLASNGDEQVGHAFFDGSSHAGMWAGSASTWIDLGELLPAGFSNSGAQGISHDEINTYVTGSGFNTVANRWEALLWTRRDCVNPSINTQPDSRLVCPTISTTFNVTATAGHGGGIAYQWQWQFPDDVEWQPIVAGLNSVAGVPQFEASGVATVRVALRPPTSQGGTRRWPHQGYRVRAAVSNVCGTTFSEAANLTICAADFNCDGFVDFFDYDEFVTVFETGSGLDADFNGDSFVDFFDYDAFVEAFETGC